MLYVNSISPSNYLLSVAEFSYTLNRDDRSVCMCGCARVYVSFGWVQRCWRSYNCLLTPPQYVRTISRTALFKGREGDADRRGGRGDKTREGEGERDSGILQQHSSTMCLSCKPLQNLTNYSPLYPPSLPLSHSFSISHVLPSSLLSTVFIRFSPTSPSPLSPPSLSPAGANNLPEEIWLAQRRAENPSLQEKWHTQAIFPSCTVLRKREMGEGGKVRQWVTIIIPGQHSDSVVG